MNENWSLPRLLISWIKNSKHPASTIFLHVHFKTYQRFRFCEPDFDVAQMLKNRFIMLLKAYYCTATHHTHAHTHPVLMKFRLCYYVTFKNTPKQKIKKSKMMLNLCDVKRMHALRHCWCKRLPLSNLRLWLQFTSTDTAANHHTRFLSWNWQFSALVIYHCNVSKRYGKWKTTVFKIKCPLTQEEM